MYPEDPVLIAYVPTPADFERVQAEGWYRIPQAHTPKGLYAMYLGFYFGRAFGPHQHAIHYYAPIVGHELTTRQQLLPHEPDHPRARERYYKVQLGEVRPLPRPIISLRWRRILFLHTTWDRFQDATEINDLFLEGGYYVDRLYAVLKERGLQPERQWDVREADAAYTALLAVPTQNGLALLRPDEVPDSDQAVTRLAERIWQQAQPPAGR